VAMATTRSSLHNAFPMDGEGGMGVVGLFVAPHSCPASRLAGEQGLLLIKL